MADCTRRLHGELLSQAKITMPHATVPRLWCAKTSSDVDVLQNQFLKCLGSVANFHCASRNTDLYEKIAIMLFRRFLC